MNKIDIINKIIKASLIDADMLFNGCRQKEYVDTRYIITKVLRNEYNCSMSEIARLLGVNKSSISRLYYSDRLPLKEFNRVLRRCCIK